MRHRLACFVLLAAAAVTGPAQAQSAGGATVYTVEIVVFRGGTGSADEDLSQAAALVAGDGDTAAADTGPSRLVQVLPAARYRLGDVVARLNASGSYRVVAHAAWQQTASAFNGKGGIPLDQVGLGNGSVSGLALLQRGQYLHLGLNVAYRGSAPYALNELRRVRLNERQYFDHPAFGIVAIVTPATP